MSVQLKIYFTDTFTIPLPEKHSFPGDKYYLLRKRIEEAKIVPPENLIVPEPASEADILRVHDPTYWNRLKNGELTAKEIRRVTDTMDIHYQTVSTALQQHQLS